MWDSAVVNMIIRGIGESLQMTILLNFIHIADLKPLTPQGMKMTKSILYLTAVLPKFPLTADMKTVLIPLCFTEAIVISI